MQIELNRTFFKANRGMESRFIWRFHLDNYSYLEMLNIFKKKVTEQEWSLQKDCLTKENIIILRIDWK